MLTRRMRRAAFGAGPGTCDRRPGRRRSSIPARRGHRPLAGTHPCGHPPGRARINRRKLAAQGPQFATLAGRLVVQGAQQRLADQKLPVALPELDPHFAEVFPPLFGQHALARQSAGQMLFTLARLIGLVFEVRGKRRFALRGLVPRGRKSACHLLQRLFALLKVRRNAGKLCFTLRRFVTGSGKTASHLL